MFVRPATSFLLMSPSFENRCYLHLLPKFVNPLVDDFTVKLTLHWLLPINAGQRSAKYKICPSQAAVVGIEDCNIPSAELIHFYSL